jgi:hypothetical protein
VQAWIVQACTKAPCAWFWCRHGTRTGGLVLHMLPLAAACYRLHPRSWSSALSRGVHIAACAAEGCRVPHRMVWWAESRGTCGLLLPGSAPVGLGLKVKWQHASCTVQCARMIRFPTFLHCRLPTPLLLPHAAKACARLSLDAGVLRSCFHSCCWFGLVSDGVCWSGRHVQLRKLYTAAISWLDSTRSKLPAYASQ